MVVPATPITILYAHNLVDF